MWMQDLDSISSPKVLKVLSICFTRLSTRVPMLKEAIKGHPRGTGHVILHAALKMWGFCEGLRGENPPSDFPFCVNLSPMEADCKGRSTAVMFFMSGLHGEDVCFRPHESASQASSPMQGLPFLNLIEGNFRLLFPNIAA